MELYPDDGCGRLGTLTASTGAQQGARQKDDQHLEYCLTHSVLNHRNAGALRLAGDKPGDAKPILVLHGLGSAKERMLTTLYTLAAAGFDAIALDLFFHGERPEAICREQMLAADFVTTLRDIIYETAADLPVLCEELGVKIEDAGVLGISAGGFAAHVLAVQRPRCRAMVAAISSPDWMRIDPSRTPDPGSPEGMLLDASSPASSPQCYAPLPICMLNGELDEVVSPLGSKRLYERIAPLYLEQKLADQLELAIYPDAGHYFSDDMLAKSVEWFCRFVR